MAIRANQLTNFKGEPYATTNQVDAKITEASSSIEEKINEVKETVQEIKSEVTDNLLDKETGNLNAKFNPIKVLSTENKTGLPAVELGEGEEKVEYFPDNDYSKIQFIGDCKVTYRNDGQIVIRIGDNLNSSNFATSDGQTQGVDNAKVTSPSIVNTGKLANGTSVNAVSSGNYTIDTATTGNLIHFDNNENTSFEVVVNDDGTDKTYYFGPITGNGTYNAKLTNAEGAVVQGASLVVSNFGEETKTSEGATGYCGSVKFTIAASSIAQGEASSVKIVSVKHNNGGEGEFVDNNLDANTRYFYTDTTTKPTITASAVTVTSNGSKTVSGVKYLTGATANYSVSFTDIANPVCIADNVSFDANKWAADANNLDAAYNATSMTGSGAVANGQWAQANNTVTVTVKNINGSVTSTATLADYSLLVDSNNTSDDALNAYFDKEDSANYPRLNSDLTEYDKTKSILTTSDLMLKDGKLIYPSGNYVGYNTILGTDFTQPNYSTGLTTGKRTWYRKFYEAGDKNGATLTFAADSAIASTAFGNTLTVKVGKIDADGTVQWYDATKKSTEAADGIATNVASNALTVDWGAYGAAKYGIIIELGMSAASHAIKTLTVAFA